MTTTDGDASPSWRNWSGIETCTPAEVLEPTSVDDIQAAVARAAERGVTVRAVGSGHSFTGAAVATGLQLRLERFSRLVDVDVASGLVTVEAGMPLRRLNPLLDQYGLA